MIMHCIIDTSDFSLETSRVHIRPMGDPKVVTITFLMDSITQEADESLTLQLLPTPSILQTMPIGEAVFFRNILDLTIMDADGESLMIILSL